ncbi:MAG TPA: asparagine synthase (glutamine-hydrolyzing) [Usitatibacter sp.]|nr:asparagine synthase (glutamine-hydrolyzing) [Usitatibacter sp.]
MCGIAGIVGYAPTSPHVSDIELDAIRDAMAVRGPDGYGSWISTSGKAGLAHRRLAIIDLSASGAQPMHCAEGRLTITFNGEIYNYRSLRQELVAKGYTFHSSSDTEVLLKLYLDRGEEMVHSLRGMYAFAICDERDQTALLARDPIGIKPLYYSDNGFQIRFASQVKALAQTARIGLTPSPAGHAGFFLWGHVPEPYTLHREIRALPAGCVARIDQRGIRVKSYFSISDELAAAGKTQRDIRERDVVVRNALRDSVAHHLVADVPVGVFLSSGIDSTALTALASETHMAGKLRTITLAFEEYRGSANDESLLAARVAKCYGTRHETHWISRADFEEELDRLLGAMDQPSIDGVNTYFVSRAAAAAGLKVALSGLGGDELFGGYPSFRQLPRTASLLRPFAKMPSVGRVARQLFAPMISRVTSPKYASLLEFGGTLEGAYLLRRALFMPHEVGAVMDARMAAEGLEELATLPQLRATTHGLESPYQKVAALELAWYMRNQLLRDADWAGMAHSLEIRVPFVDVALLRAVAPFMSNAPARKAAIASAPAKPLPSEITSREKTGFSIPVREWLKGAHGSPRGLRAWAVRVCPPIRRLRAMVLLTDAFGGFGGIAKFNRDLLNALCSAAGCEEVVALPRVASGTFGTLPPKLRYISTAVGNKARYAMAVLATAFRAGTFGTVICGHINLFPLAWLASAVTGSRLVLVIHGIDAWRPARNPLSNFLIRRIDGVISVSSFTANRFASWSRVKRDKARVLPNSVDLEAFRPGPKSEDLLERYGLRGCRVLLTMARLAANERYKGLDEVLEVLPRLLRANPDLRYVIVGDGNDRSRLEAKAAALKLTAQVIFTGYVPEAEKRDHLNLADAFVMPSRGEGFGIVFLEALACGVPVVGGSVDGSREALMDGKLGALVDPADSEALERAILEALAKPRRVNEALSHFSFRSFERRVHEMVAAWQSA